MYKRIVLKISGEALSGEQQGVTFFQPVVDELVRQIKVILQKGTQVSLVIGGGNFGQNKSRPNWYVGNGDECDLCSRCTEASRC